MGPGRSASCGHRCHWQMQWSQELLEELDIEWAPGEDSRERDAKQKTDRRDNKLSTMRQTSARGSVTSEGDRSTDSQSTIRVRLPQNAAETVKKG